MNVPGFTSEALQFVNELLYAEKPDPLKGVCGASRIRKQNKKPPTAAEQAAAAKRVGQPNTVPESARQAGAKKAAATRKKCKEQKSDSSNPDSGFTV
jgi:hypothetical protein